MASTFQSRVGIDGDSYPNIQCRRRRSPIGRFSPVSGLMGIPTVQQDNRTVTSVRSFQSRVGIDGDSYAARAGTAARTGTGFSPVSGLMGIPTALPPHFLFQNGCLEIVIAAICHVGLHIS